jgi:hypothetical protein
MKNTLHIVLVVFAVLVLAAGIFFAGVMFARATPFGFGSMMGGYGGSNQSASPYGYGPGGMMGGAGPNGMMGGTGPNGMMGGGNANPNAAPLTIDQMKAAAETYIKNSGLTGLEVGEIMVFNNNAYASVVEKSTMMGAFELLADSGTQVAYPEYGPNMMWNLKYGGMSQRGMMGGGSGGGMMGGNGGGMMGGWTNGKATPANVPADMPITIEQAIANAQAYLDQYFPGAKAAADPTQFYGYYTMDFERNGKVAGMLSVNGYNGQVFLHTWHGTFVEESGMKMK